MAKRVHFLGIGGSGTSAAAAIAQAQGYEVTGCDLNPHNEFTIIFQPNQLQTGHNPKHLDDIDILAVTPAIFSLDPDNSELTVARQKGIEVLTWQQFVGKYLAKDKFVIAVCGTHGKTTTTAMIAQMLEDARQDPTVELGGIVPKWKANFRIGEGRYFVVEADEFNDNFLSHYPQITVVTNIEMDHPEYFKDFEEVKRSFAKFVSQSKKVFDKPDPNLINFKLKVPGEFNVANASLAFQVGLALGIKPNIIRKSLEEYSGVSRRFEYLGEFNKAKIYSDFAHHPTEIKTTMEAARQKFPKERIILVYQPHMFSRTKALFEDFVKVFQNLPVNKTFLVDIYPSREKDTGLVTSKQLIDATAKDSVTYIGSINETLEKLKPQIKSKDIVFFMGAGSIDQIARKLVTQQKYCTIYIVRHGQTDWNAQGLIQGHTDIPLNNEGIKQAQLLNQSLKNIKFDAIYSSDLVRAKKTAEIVALEREIAINTSKLLKERRYGKFEGKPYKEMKEVHKIWMDLDKQQRLTFRPDSAYETDGEIISRLIVFLREVAASRLGQTVLIVAHGGLMRVLLNHLSDKTYHTGSIENSAYIKLKSGGVDFFIEELVGIKEPNE